MLVYRDLIHASTPNMTPRSGSRLSGVEELCLPGLPGLPDGEIVSLLDHTIHPVPHQTQSEPDGDL
jgi:hypothetical protein